MWVITPKKMSKYNKIYTDGPLGMLCNDMQLTQARNTSKRDITVMWGSMSITPYYTLFTAARKINTATYKFDDVILPRSLSYEAWLYTKLQRGDFG